MFGRARKSARFNANRLCFSAPKGRHRPTKTFRESAAAVASQMPRPFRLEGVSSRPNAARQRDSCATLFRNLLRYRSKQAKAPKEAAIAVVFGFSRTVAGRRIALIEGSFVRIRFGCFRGHPGNEPLD